MDLLITVIGNAVVHEDFRHELLDDYADPIVTIERWGFHLTKGEGEMLTAIFRRQSNGRLERLFHALWVELHKGVRKMSVIVPPCKKPCMMSVPKLRAFQEIERMSKAEHDQWHKAKRRVLAKKKKAA